MTSDLPDGTLFVARNGRARSWLWELSTLQADSFYRDRVIHNAGTRLMGGVCRPVQPGEIVYRAVFKGDALVTKAQYVIKPGDVEWVDTGMVSPFSDRAPIFENRFVGGPKWLRDVT